MATKLTKQGLRESLYSAMEFGFKAHERGDNLEMARHNIASHIEALVGAAANCPTEILRIDFRKGRGTKLSHVLRDGEGGSVSQPAKLTQYQVKKIIQKVSEGRRKKVVCSLIGHSLIVSGCFGYVYCGRCGEQVADSLGGINANAKKQVYIGHNCKTCRTNYARMGWRDKWLVPNPFKKSRRSR